MRLYLNSLYTRQTKSRRILNHKKVAGSLNGLSFGYYFTLSFFSFFFVNSKNNNLFVNVITSIGFALLLHNLSGNDSQSFCLPFYLDLKYQVGTEHRFQSERICKIHSSVFFLFSIHSTIKIETRDFQIQHVTIQRIWTLCYAPVYRAYCRLYTLHMGIGHIADIYKK